VFLFIEQIEAAILKLPPDELQQLLEWFLDLDYQRWDEQLEKDVADGKLEVFSPRGDHAISTRTPCKQFSSTFIRAEIITLIAEPSRLRNCVSKLFTSPLVCSSASISC